MADRSLGGVDEEVEEPGAATGGNRSVSLHPDVTKWRVSDVLQWLDSRGLGRFAAQFRENDVTGATAPTRPPARADVRRRAIPAVALMLPQMRFRECGMRPRTQPPEVSILIIQQNPDSFKLGGRRPPPISASLGSTDSSQGGVVGLRYTSVNFEKEPRG